MDRIRRYWDIVFHALFSPESRPTGNRVVFAYYPSFDSQEVFNDHYYRMIWYLHPIIERIDCIMVPFSGAILAIEEPPPFLDARIKELTPRFVDRIIYKFDDSVECADIIMLWQVTPDMERQAKRRFPGKRIWRVDHQTVRYAGSFYLKASSELDEELLATAIEESAMKFQSILDDIRSDIGYIFGTGPNLQQVIDRDYSDGVSIACNSMLKNRRLMENLRPPLITIADPIFHAGPSAYAGRFRSYLHDALDVFGSYLIVPIRDYVLYCENLDPRWKSRIIGVPYVDEDRPNLDLSKRYLVSSTNNIMTLFLIPLSCTFFKHIYMAGFDGRPLEENDYFWQHDPASQIVTEMDSIQLAHPAFFAIDYDDYYLRHISIVEQWLSAAEREGKTVKNLTPSYVPALKARTV